MGKLSHIDDVESPNAAQGQATASGAQPADADAQPAPEPLDPDGLTSEQEEEFHGLEDSQPLGAGHKTLIILAVIVVIVAILYIVNSWIHFI